MKNAPSRDTIILWSAVIAGIGLLALLVRHAAIYRFGTDAFTGNVLFGVIFILLVSLYLGFQSVIEDFSRAIYNFFRRKKAVVIAETTSGEQIAVPAMSEPLQMDYCSEATTTDCEVLEEDVEFSNDLNEHPYEVIDIMDDGTRHIRFADGSEGYASAGLSDEEILLEHEYQTNCQDFDEDAIFQDFISGLTEQEKYDYENNIKRVKIESNEEYEFGCFATVPEQNVIDNHDGTTTIEEYESTVFITANGDVIFLQQLDDMIKFYNEHKETTEKIITQKKECDEAYEELLRNEELYNTEQVTFICAYITFTMQGFMESHELDKLHLNAKMWTKTPLADFNAVKLRKKHQLSKEDLKHLGYNIGKFLRLKGPVIATFVKTVFYEPFSKLQLQSINSKLTDTNPDKDKIPLLSREQMDALFEHFKRYKTINLKVVENKGKSKK